mgnify:CR=1 FL=1
MAKFVDRVHRCFGRIDYLVNNVGTDTAAAVHDVSPEEWHRSQDVLLNAPFYLSKAVLPHMRGRRFGRIVNIGAAAAAAKAGAGMGAYAASKAGVLKLTESLADEAKNDGITVNAILPTTIDTAANRKDMPRADFSKWVQPDEIAALIEYLLSDKASAVTGANIPIAGRV